VDHFKKLAADFPNVPDHQSGVGGALNNWAAWLVDEGKPEAARQLLREAITWQEKAVQANPKSPKYCEFLCKHYHQLASVLEPLKSPEREQNLSKALLRLGQQERAEGALRQAITIGEALVKDFRGERTFLESLADDYSRLGLVLPHETPPKKKEEAFRQARKRWQQLVDGSPKVALYRSRLANVLHNLAILFARERKLEQARPLLQDAIRHQQAAYKAEPERYRAKLLHHYQTLVRILLDLSDHAAAAKWAPEMAPVSGRDWKPCYQAAGYLERCLSLVAKDAELGADRRKELTQTYQRQFWPLLAETAKRNPDHPRVQSHLAVFLATCPEPKYRDAARAVELAGKAAKQNPGQGGHWGILGLAHYRAGNWKEAITMIEKARGLKSGGDVLFFLAMAYWKQGEKQLAHQRHDEALLWSSRHRVTLGP
jgi:tetratricopeptide (TPR) repeat protein